MKSKNLHVGGESDGPPARGVLRSWGPAASWAALIFGLSAVPGSSYPSQPFASADLLVHAVVFGILGALLVRGCRLGLDLADRACFLWSAGLASAYGVTDEVHQMFVPQRFADWRDAAADALGAALGAALALWIARRRPR